MKLKYLLIAIVVLIQTSCFRSSIPTANDIEFKSNHASIQNGMNMDEVRALLGEPMNRQFMDNQEAWQYCEASMTSREYYSVSFVDKKVNGINTYAYGTNSHKGCLHCEECFKEIRFRNLNIRTRSDANKNKLSDKNGETIISDDDRTVKINKNKVSDKNRNTIISADDLSAEFSKNGTIVIGYFRSGSDEIDNLVNEDFVLGLVNKINEGGNKYSIVGHTNSQGALEPNQKLSDKRAQETEKFLIAKYGLLPNKVTLVGKGEMDPIGDNETREGRRKNSRVEIRIIK